MERWSILLLRNQSKCSANQQVSGAQWYFKNCELVNDKEAETGGKLLPPTGALDLMMRPMKTIGLGSPASSPCCSANGVDVLMSFFQDLAELTTAWQWTCLRDISLTIPTLCSLMRIKSPWQLYNTCIHHPFVRPLQWTTAMIIFQSNFFLATIHGFSMVLPVLDYHHWMFFEVLGSWNFECNG